MLVKIKAMELYKEAVNRDIEVLLDDRKIRPGILSLVFYKIFDVYVN